MTRAIDLSCKHIIASSLALSLFVPLAGAHAADNTLYTFSGGSDGGNPPCGLISGGKGVLPAKTLFYGTTEVGGTSGYGTVFQIDGAGSESVIYSFTGGSDGAYPLASLIADPAGNLYGTTKEGGAYGFGVVFKVMPGGAESALYSFTGGSDGANPVASLILDPAGNLYGTAEAGGAKNLGVVFEVAPGGTETVLHSFTGGSGAATGGDDGANPVASLIMDSSGDLYGTTEKGGAKDLGTVFKLAPGGSETVLHSFAGGSDGASPFAGVIMDKKQNLYGTTSGGSAGNDGTVFELARTGKEMVLHSFTGGSDGAFPVSGVTENGSYLFGTTKEGGAGGSGTVFRTPVKPGSDIVLYSFTGGSDGGLPEGDVLDVGGNLFGTTYAGGQAGCDAGAGCGVVFEITP